MVKPASIDQASRDAIETDDVVCCEQAVEDEPDHACDAVLGQVVHGIVDAEVEFYLGAEVGDDADCDAKDDGGPGWDEAGCWGGGYEAGDAT